MMISTYELTRILNRPGYTVLNGSLPTGTATTPRQKESSRLWASEREFQAAVIAECDLRAVLEPEYAMVYHIANENSHRQPGVRGGVCDLCLPVLRVGATEIYGACYIELKTGKNTLSGNQRLWIERLRAEGNFVEVVWDDLDRVMSIFEEYLAI